MRSLPDLSHLSKRSLRQPSSKNELIESALSPELFPDSTDSPDFARLIISNRGELERLATTKKIAKKLRVSQKNKFLQKKTLRFFQARSFFDFFAEQWRKVSTEKISI